MAWVPFYSISSSHLTNAPAQPILRLQRRFCLDEDIDFSHAIILIMEVGDMRLYKERWKAVEEIERQELRAMTPEQHWQKLNAIVRFATETGMAMESNDGEMEVWLRWAKLKARYEAGPKPETG